MGGAGCVFGGRGGARCRRRAVPSRCPVGAVARRKGGGHASNRGMRTATTSAAPCSQGAGWPGMRRVGGWHAQQRHENPDTRHAGWARQAIWAVRSHEEQDDADGAGHPAQPGHHARQCQHAGTNHRAAGVGGGRRAGRRGGMVGVGRAGREGSRGLDEGGRAAHVLQAGRPVAPKDVDHCRQQAAGLVMWEACRQGGRGDRVLAEWHLPAGRCCCRQ